MTAAGLVADDVLVRFGGLVALDGVTIEVPPGRITGLIGPNGAGKTTLFNVCCGYQPPTAGRVSLDGVDVSTDSPNRRARRGLGRTFQRMELFRSMTVRENVELAAEARFVDDNPLTTLGAARRGRAVQREVHDTTERLLGATGLAPVAGDLAGVVSTGHGRLLELARALARRPSILLLDEPSSGLDTAETLAFGDLLADLSASEGVGILLVEHDMSLVLRVSSWVHVLDFGKPIFAGTPAAARASDVVRAAYLGDDDDDLEPT